MRIERDNFCFACGKDNPRGLKMDIEIDEKRAQSIYRVRPEYQGWRKITHGGILSTILDEMMVWAAAGREIHTITAEMTVRFKNPLPTDRTVKVEGRVVEEKKRIILAEAKVFDEEKVYAEATGKLFRVT